MCDDNSADHTVEILERFSASAVFPVYILRNPANLGSTRNFEKALSQCTGDIIALCDQDDVWRDDKLHLIEEAFTAFPDAGFVFSNGTVVSEDLAPLGYSLSDRFKFDSDRLSRGKTFEFLLNRNVVTGATMAFRSGFTKLVTPISPLYVHDAWIATLLSAISEAVFIDQELIRYRQHKKQQIGAVAQQLAQEVHQARSVKDYSYEIRQLDELLHHMQQNQAVFDASALSMVYAQAAHLKTRQEIYRSSAFAGIAKSLGELLGGRYHRHSSGYRSFIKDVAVILGY